MGYKEKTVGGGPAKGLADDFTKFLQQFINTGSFGGGTAGQQFAGADPSGDSQDIFGLLNSLISNPSADQSVQSLINKDIERGRNDLRARYGAGGGMAFGSPAAFAEGIYQAEQAPRTAMAMDQMAQQRLAALMPLFGFAQNISGMGIPQAQTVMQPKPWMEAINLGLDVANTVASFMGAPSGSAGRSAAPNMPSPQLSGSTIPQVPLPMVRYPTPGVTRGTTSGMPGSLPMPFGNPTQQVYR